MTMDVIRRETAIKTVFSPSWVFTPFYVVSHPRSPTMKKNLHFRSQQKSNSFWAIINSMSPNAQINAKTHISHISREAMSEYTLNPLWGQPPPSATRELRYWVFNAQCLLFLMRKNFNFCLSSTFISHLGRHFPIPSLQIGYSTSAMLETNSGIVSAPTSEYIGC